VTVAEVLDGGTKTAFYNDLRQSLDVARRAANKAVTFCVGADTELMTGGKAPKLYTYPQVAKEFPGVTTVAASLCRDVERKYRQERWLVAAGRKSVCHYRSYPWPLLSRMTTIRDHGEFIAVRIKLLGGWWTVRLAGGSSYRDQIAGLRSAAKVGDSKIWTDRKNKAVVGLSVAFDEESRIVNKRGTLYVATSRDALLIATKTRTDTPFTINGDQVKQWVAQRTRLYQRLRQDRKSGASRRVITRKLQEAGKRWQRRVTTIIHETTAHIVDHARRRKVAKVELDATIKSFVPQFPYYQLAEKLRYKCEDAGIEFSEVTQSVENPGVNKPHVYFKLAPTTNRVKIGMTLRSDGGRHGAETDAPEELIILAVDNQPKSKVRQKEKHWQAYFSEHRVNKQGRKSEWFDAAPVVHWLREAGWLGNAGNVSQIAQVIPLHEHAADDPPPGSSVSLPDGNDPRESSQDAEKRRGYTGSNPTALAMAD